jgi:hypothetical protein
MGCLSKVRPPACEEIPRISANYKGLAVTHAPELSLCFGGGCDGLGLDRKIAILLAFDHTCLAGIQPRSCRLEMAAIGH